jgi:hypothetical protein
VFHSKRAEGFFIDEAWMLRADRPIPSAERRQQSGAMNIHIGLSFAHRNLCIPSAMYERRPCPMNERAQAHATICFWTALSEGWRMSPVVSIPKCLAAVCAVEHHLLWQGTTTMIKRVLFNPTMKRYFSLECITAAAFAVLIAIVVLGSSNEKVSAMSAFSLERYLMSSTR